MLRYTLLARALCILSICSPLQAMDNTVRAEAQGRVPLDTQAVQGRPKNPGRRLPKKLDKGQPKRDAELNQKNSNPGTKPVPPEKPANARPGSVRLQAKEKNSDPGVRPMPPKKPANTVLNKPSDTVRRFEKFRPEPPKKPANAKPGNAGPQVKEKNSNPDVWSASPKKIVNTGAEDPGSQVKKEGGSVFKKSLLIGSMLIICICMCAGACQQKALRSFFSSKKSKYGRKVKESPEPEQSEKPFKMG